MNPFLKAALSYARQGWSVIPLEPRGKNPLVKWKSFQTERADENQIKKWWTDWPDANIGVVTGAISGMFVLDVDGEEGQKSIEGRDLRATVTSRTGRGSHYYFKIPEGRKIENKVGILKGVDIRGEGGYVVVPPSIHSTGRTYEWTE